MAEEGNLETSSNANSSQFANTIENLIKTIISPQSQFVTVHLNEANYLLWYLQVEIAIQGYGLEGYILGTMQIPLVCITDKENKIISNEEYVRYHRQDRLICSCLLSSIK